jgi:hypothetical protein
MKKLCGILLAILLSATVSWAQDQYPKVSSSGGDEYNHAEAGAFFEYYRFNNPVAPDTNFYGVGGRVGFNVARHVQLEAEGSWDPEQNADLFASGVGGFVTSPIRVVHFMFGPKFQAGSTGPVRFFVTVKGGLIDFSSSASFTGQVTSIPTSETDATFYPGLGFEFFEKWLGVRFEAGDEMYFNGGVNHNARVTAGPVIRF